MIRLQGQLVVLRAFDPSELDRVVEVREHDPTLPRTPRSQLLRRLERSGRLVRGRLDLAIEADSELVGEVDARQPANALPPGVFELGIVLYDAGRRGRGYGSEAVELLTNHLFANEGAERVQGSTALGNGPMRRVFTKLGFAEEGVMRGFMPAGDRREDYALYGVTKEEWRQRDGGLVNRRVSD